jgi:hypothetical protein
MVYLCNGAVNSAVNSRHDVVTETDIVSAEASYSQFAYEALLVENGITVQQLDRVLLEFAGSDSVLPASAVRGYLSVAGIGEDMMDYVMERLRAVSFLGVEIGPSEFQYIEGESDSLKLDVLARKYCQGSRQEPRYSIHPAYRTYLEIREL